MTAFVAAALLLLAASGCGVPAPSSIDAARAREVLVSALDAWRDGESADALADRSPAIRIADHEWRGGAKLEAYELRGDGTPSGPEWRCKALLTVRGADGKLKKRPASYAVATAPVLAIVREER